MGTAQLLLLTLSVLTLCDLFVTLPTIAKKADKQKCAETDDNCREKYLHPNLPEQPRLRKLSGEETSEYWLNNGIDFVQQKVGTANQPQRDVAKNVIFFIGDGMSLSTISATRVYMGGEELSLSFEKFADTGLARTYAIDRLVPDSASTATAFLSGSKSMYGTLGVNGHVRRGDCEATKNSANYVDSIAKWALKAGKSVGLVTTTRVTHATPAALYAHSSERDWENDKQVKDDCGKNSGVEDIASQLITGEVGSQLKVVLGGGKKHFIDRDLYEEGKRRDGRNLIDEFLAQNAQNVYVEKKQDLLKLKATSEQRVLGLFHDNHLLYNVELDGNSQQPTLQEMTLKAIELLSDAPNGYLLFVEAGKIDLAHHKNRAMMALDETEQLSEAVQAARTNSNQQDTLIVVSADHSHTMSVAGYATRSNDIFDGPLTLADDEVPYLTLSYANGPSFAKFYDTKNNARMNPTSLIKHQVKDVFPATVPLESETHDAEDVAVYASGPWSHLFSGVYEQSTIPHIIAYASCIGHGQKACHR